LPTVLTPRPARPTARALVTRRRPGDERHDGHTAKRPYESMPQGFEPSSNVRNPVVAMEVRLVPYRRREARSLCRSGPGTLSHFHDHRKVVIAGLAEPLLACQVLDCGGPLLEPGVSAKIRSATSRMVIRWSIAVRWIHLNACGSLIPYWVISAPLARSTALRVSSRSVNSA